MTRTHCSACGSRDLEPFLNLGRSPVADAYTATPDEPVQTFPLQVAFCSKCGLVQLLEVLDAQTLFGTGYSFYSSASAPLSQYHKEYATALHARYPDQIAKGVLEIGCNDGDLLRWFKEWPHLGVDPAGGPLGVAADRDLATLYAPFTVELAAGLDFSPGVIVANHVLAHVEDVSDFLAGIALLARPDTIIMIEVQYLPDLLLNNAFDLVYHEHRNFFSLTSLRDAAAKHGLFAIDAQLTSRQGGSLRVTMLRRGSVSDNIAGYRRVRAIAEDEVWLRSYGAYEGMQGRAERVRSRLLGLLASHEGDVGIYGAPAKVTTLLHFCGLTRGEFSICWDTTKAKQGRYIPGTDIQIVEPWSEDHERPPTFLLAAHNYAEQIMAENPGFMWILPLPAPIVIPS